MRVAFEAVPWVRRATVRREWPNQLIVTLEEHEPLGTWGEDGRLLSVKGDVFTANLAEAEEDGELPEFDGPPGSEKEVLARFRELRAWFAPIKLAPESLQLSSRYAWTVKLDNGMNVELGREQNRETLKDAGGAAGADLSATGGAPAGPDRKRRHALSERAGAEGAAV